MIEDEQSSNVTSDITMYYEIQGQGEPIVLIPGVSNNYTIWLDVASYAPLDAAVKASLSWVFSYQYLMQDGINDQLVKNILNNAHPFTLQKLS